MIKLLLVDDQPSVRMGLRMRLALEPDVAVVGEAGDGEAAITLARTLHPDVIVMDVKMPHMDGIVTTEALRAAVPYSSVVILSLYDDAITRARAEAAGASAFIQKQGPMDVLLAAIRQIMPQSST
ncbi:MAG TPA: response regulator transcription factor [Herpetosiphonaceae bacterium]